MQAAKFVPQASSGCRRSLGCSDILIGNGGNSSVKRFTLHGTFVVDFITSQTGGLIWLFALTRVIAECGAIKAGRGFRKYPAASVLTQHASECQHDDGGQCRAGNDIEAV
jgi:hypothetical protein